MPFDAASPPEVTARDRMIRLRDHLAKLPAKEFDMAHWHCGTTACIGGWVENLFCGTRYVTVDGAAGALIGLSPTESQDLFYPARFCTKDFAAYEATPVQAVAVLDHYLATGEIDWSVVK